MCVESYRTSAYSVRTHPADTLAKSEVCRHSAFLLRHNVLTCKLIRTDHLSPIKAAAENARVLNGFKSDPNARFGLTVLISDPAARAKRSDDSNSTLFIGGLESKTTQQDVRSLFQKASSATNPTDISSARFAISNLAGMRSDTVAAGLRFWKWRQRYLKSVSMPLTLDRSKGLPRDAWSQVQCQAPQG